MNDIELLRKLAGLNESVTESYTPQPTDAEAVAYYLDFELRRGAIPYLQPQKVISSGGTSNLDLINKKGQRFRLTIQEIPSTLKDGNE